MRPPLTLPAALLQLVNKGPATTRELCEQLREWSGDYEPSTKGVDQAIATLRKARCVESSSGASQGGSPGRRGRPARTWKITQHGRELAQQHRLDVLALMAIDG